MRFIRHQHFRSLARQFAVAVLTLCAATDCTAAFEMTTAVASSRQTDNAVK